MHVAEEIERRDGRTRNREFDQEIVCLEMERALEPGMGK
jgi:hypothetical protein